MKKTVFWLGVIILVVGVILFGYGYMTIQNMKAAYEPYLDLQFAFHPELIQQWDLAILLRWIGLGMLILGAIVLAYGLWVKKESKQLLTLVPLFSQELYPSTTRHSR